MTQNLIKKLKKSANPRKIIMSVSDTPHPPTLPLPPFLSHLLVYLFLQHLHHIMTIFQTPHTPPSFHPLPPPHHTYWSTCFCSASTMLWLSFRRPTPHLPSTPLPPPHHTYWSTCFCSASTMLWLSFRRPTPPTPFPSPLPITFTGPLVSAAPPPYYDYLSDTPHPLPFPPPHHTYWSTCFCSASTIL